MYNKNMKTANYKTPSLFWSIVSTALLSLVWAMSAMFINFNDFSWSNPDQIYLMVITAVAGMSATSSIYLFLIKLPGFSHLHKSMMQRKEAKHNFKIKKKEMKYQKKMEEKEQKKLEKKEKKLNEKNSKQDMQEDKEDTNVEKKNVVM